jgi:Fimbrial assembly protein (PilN)
MDLNKEIKLSDLFRRRRDTAVEAVTKEEKPPAEPKERKSFSFSLGRKEPKAPKEPKTPKEPKAPKVRKTAAKAVPPPPAVPLMRAFDLMPKEETREKGARVGLAKIAVALLGLVLLGGLAAAYLFSGAGAMSKQGELDDLRSQLAELEVPAEEPTPGAPALASDGQARTTALSAALAARIAWDRVLREVSLVVPEDVWLTQLSATTPNAASGGAAAPAVTTGSTSPNSLAAVGFAGSQESVALFLSRLESIPELTTVQLQASTRTESETGRAYSFSILAGVNPLGAASS